MSCLAPRVLVVVAVSLLAGPLGACGADPAPIPEDVNVSPPDAAPTDTPAEVESDLSSNDDGLTSDMIEARAAPGHDPQLAGFCAGAPARLGAGLAWTDSEGLHIARSLSGSIDDIDIVTPLVFVAGSNPRSPVTLEGSDAARPAVVLAVDDASGATLHVFGRDGRAISTVAAPGESSATPRGSGRILAWPLADRASGRGRLAWVDVILGREIFALEIDSAPLTQPAAFGNDLVSGGGSHWLVGTSDGIIAVRDTLVGRRLSETEVNLAATPVPRIVGRWSTTDGHVRQVLTFGGLVVVGLARAEDAGVQRFRTLRPVFVPPDTWSFEVVGPDIIAPGPVTTHPAAWSCNDAGEVSGWHCPRGADGTLVVAGDGWLKAFSLPDGLEIHHNTDDIRWTGLALGRGGWVAGGGSHWLPADDTPRWRVVSYVPSLGESVELLAGVGGGCVPAPIWDTDGTFAGVAPGASPFVVAGRHGKSSIGVLAPGIGWSRPHGDDRNGGKEVVEVGACGDGLVRAHEHFPLGSEEIAGVSHGDFRDVIFGSKNGIGHYRLLPGFGFDTAVDLPDSLALQQLVVVGRTSVVVARTSNDGSATQSLRRYEDAGNLAFDHVLAAEDGALAGLVEPAPGVWFVAARRGDRDVIHRVSETEGWQEAREFGEGTPDIGLVHLLPAAARNGAERGGDGAVMVIVADNRLVLRRIDAQLDEVATATWSDATTLSFIDAAVDWNGRIRVIVEDVGSPSAGPLLLQYSSELQLESTIVLPASGSLAFDGLSASLVASSAGIFRVGLDGTIGAVYPVGAGLFPLANGVTFNGNGFAAFHETSGPSGRNLVRVHTDLIGLGACGAAGACLNRNADACDGNPEPCVAKGCEPATGTCASTSFEGCQVSPQGGD